MIKKSKPIQFLRFFAAFVVILYHWGVGFKSGFLGVDIFFVISGFVIGLNYLFDNDFNIKIFYKKRIKRLLPMATFTIILGIITTYLTSPQTISSLRKTIQALVLYYYNFYSLLMGKNYYSDKITQEPFYHLWSLSVEEEFYLTFSILLFLLIILKINKTFYPIVLVVTFSSLTYYLVNLSRDPLGTFYLPWSRGWEFGVGVLLAYHYPKIKTNSKKIISYINPLALISLVTLTTTSLASQIVLPIYSTVLVMIFILTMKQSILGKIFSLKALSFGGDLSYGLYLLHVPIFLLTSYYLPGKYKTIISAVLLVILTTFLHLKFENPLRYYQPKKFKLLFKPWLIFATSILLPLLLVISLDYSLNHNSLAKKDFINKINLQARGELFIPSNCYLQNDDTKVKECLSGDKFSSKVAILYGDSHAQQWYHLLTSWAHSNKYKLYSITKPSCGVPDLNYHYPSLSSTPYAACDTWKVNALAKMKELKPQVIFFSTATAQQYFKSEPSNEIYREKLNDSLQKLKNISKKVVYISDTPISEQNTPKCLMKNYPFTNKCNFKENQKISLRKTLIKEVVFSEGINIINFNKEICSENPCEALKNNNLVYRDETHISQWMSMQLLDLFTQKVTKILGGTTS